MYHIYTHVIYALLPLRSSVIPDIGRKTFFGVQGIRNGCALVDQVDVHMCMKHRTFCTSSFIFLHICGVSNTVPRNTHINNINNSISPLDLKKKKTSNHLPQWRPGFHWLIKLKKNTRTRENTKLGKKLKRGLQRPSGKDPLGQVIWSKGPYKAFFPSVLFLSFLERIWKKNLGSSPLKPLDFPFRLYIDTLCWPFSYLLPFTFYLSTLKKLLNRHGACYPQTGALIPQ